MSGLRLILGRNFKPLLSNSQEFSHKN